MAKEHRISVKVTEDFKKRLSAAFDSVGLSESSIVKSLAEAAASHIEANKSYTLPSIVIPESEYKALKDRLPSALSSTSDPEIHRIAEAMADALQRNEDLKPFAARLVELMGKA